MAALVRAVRNQTNSQTLVHESYQPLQWKFDLS